MTAIISAPADLLGLADAILDGSIGVPGTVAARGAAVVARQVLEETIERRCRALADTTTRPTNRSQLILVRELGDPGVAHKAALAWDGLSRASHHHSYELEPTAMEVHRLIRLVRVVIVESEGAIREAPDRSELAIGDSQRRTD